MDITLMDALTIAVTIVGALVTFATGYEKLIVKPKEKKRLERQKRYAELREKERQELVEIRKKEYEQLLQTIETSFIPHVERGRRTKERVGTLEDVVSEHDNRIATLERDKDGNYQYKEHYKEGE